MKHNPVLDAMRWWAIIWVLLAHVGKLFWSDMLPRLWKLFSYWRYGVQVFFIVSAFTIFLSIGYKLKHNTFSFPSFMIRRFFRIFPLFFVIFSIYFLVDYFTAHTYSIWLYVLTISFLKPWFPVAQSLSYDIGLERTLTVEVLFYCIAPGLFMFFTTHTAKRVWWMAVAFFVCTSLMTLIMRQFDGGNSVFFNYLYTYPIHQITVFFFGILLYYIHYAQNGLLLWCKNKVSQYGWYGIVSLWFILIAQYIYAWYIPFQHLVVSLLITLLLFYQLQIYSKYLVNTYIIHIGKISYSIYLIHAWVIRFLIESGIVNTTNIGISFLLYLWLTYSISIITYKYIEYPWMHYGKKISNHFSWLKTHS